VELDPLASPFDTQEGDIFALEQPVETDLSSYGTEKRPYIAPVDYSNFDPNMFASLGLDNLGKIEDGLNLDLMQEESNRQRTEQIGNIGLSRDYFTDEQFSDDKTYFDMYTPKLEEFKQGQRDSLTELFSTDSEKFGQVYEGLDPNSQLNFLEGQYSSGNLDRTEYLNLAANTLYAEQKRLYPDRKEPLNHYYIKNDRLYEVSNQFSDDVNADFHSKEVILFDDQKLITNDPRRNETQLFRDAIGSTNYESAVTDSTWVKARDNVIAPLARIGASIATGGMSSAVESAIKGISGETLHAGDWASLGTAGLEQAGVISPPADGSSVAGPSGIGPTMPTDGVGIGGLNYTQTKALINAAATGDATTAVVGMLGEAAVNKVLEGSSDNSRLLGMFQADDAKKALMQVVTKVADGKTLDKAMLSGLKTYIEEGGGLGGLDWDSYDIGPLGDVISELVAPLRSVTSALGGIIEDVGQAVGDVIEPFANVVEDAAKPVGDVIEDVAQVTGDVVEDVGQVVGDKAEDLAQAINDLTPDVTVELPDIDLPSVDLPNISLGMLTGASTLSPTRTTDDIFKEDLFKLKTKIGISPVEQLLRTPQAQQQEVVGLYDDPFASSFDERNTF